MRKNLLTVFLCLCLSILMSAQDSLLCVKVTNSNLLPLSSSGILTKDLALNRLFLLNAVKKYYQAYPSAKWEVNRKYYYIELNGSAANLVSELKKKNLFEEINVWELPKITEECENPFSTNDPINGWQIEKIEAPCAWEITKSDPGTIISMIDTEFFTEHEDLKGKFVSIWYERPNTPTSPHGTATSGHAAANTNNNLGLSSIGFNSSIAGYQVYSPNGSGNPGTAILKAYDDGRKIINVSWHGTGLSNSMAREISESGVSLVIAAGNPAGEFHSSVSSVPGVIIVTSSHENDRYSFEGNNNARYPNVDLCAP